MKLFDLMIKALDTKANIHVFVGVEGNENVRFFGEFDYEELPFRAVHDFDVTLFKVNKKNQLEVWTTYTCEDMEDFTDLVERFN